MHHRDTPKTAVLIDDVRCVPVRVARDDQARTHITSESVELVEAPVRIFNRKRTRHEARLQVAGNDGADVRQAYQKRCRAPVQSKHGIVHIVRSRPPITTRRHGLRPNQ